MQVDYRVPRSLTVSSMTRLSPKNGVNRRNAEQTWGDVLESAFSGGSGVGFPTPAERWKVAGATKVEQKKSHAGVACERFSAPAVALSGPRLVRRAPRVIHREKRHVPRHMV